MSNLIPNQNTWVGFVEGSAALPARTVSAATTTGDATLTVAAGGFTTADVGRTVTGAGIPGGTTIISRTSATEVEMSANATATADPVSVVLGSVNGFGVLDFENPTAAEIALAVDLTDYLVTLNASATGNTVPTPRLKRLFETSVPGTSTAQFTADFYRDDEIDLAWDLLPRGKRGTFLIKRFGGTGLDGAPAVGEEVEVWPVIIVSRAGGALQSGTAQMFSLTASVPEEPAEDAVVAA